MASDRTLRLFILGDSSSGEAALNKTAATAATTGTKVAKSGEEAGAKFSAGIESGATRAGSGLQKLGNTLGQWGIPFSGRLTKIGNDLNNIETRGKGVAEAMSAIGGVATLAIIGLGAEAVKTSDQFEVAQANLQTSIKNSGNSWDAYKGKVDNAYASAAKLGFENNDVATGLQILVTATQSPTKAFNDLGTAENIARARHESLTDASGQLAKILGGNTRLLQQWGINLDVGSGKLHSIQSAEEALQKAQLSRQHVQAEVNDGQLKGVNASYALAKSKLDVRNAELNLQQSQKAIPEILAAINQRTKGMADAYGKTLPGELQTARSEIHNLATGLGGDLVPAIDKVIGLGSDVVGFFNKSKAGAVALAVVIGGPLAASLAVFAFNRAVSVVTGLQKMASGFTSLATTAAEKLGIIDVAAREDAALQAQTSSVIIESQAAIQTAWAKTEAAIASISAQSAELIGISATEVEGLSADFVGLGTAAAAGAAEAEAAMTGLVASVTAEDGAIISANEVAGASFTAMLGPIGLVAAGLAGLYLLRNRITPLSGSASGGDITAQQAAASFQTLKKQGESPSELGAFVKDFNTSTGGTSVGGYKLSKSGQIIGTAPKTIQALGQIQADTIAEKGLTGLALSAQKLQVKLDKLEAFGAPATEISKAQASLQVANAKAIAQEQKKLNTPGSTIPNLGDVPIIGGGAGSDSAAKALSKLKASAASYLAGLADEANPDTNASLASLRSKLHTDTNSKNQLAAKTLEDKLNKAGQTGLADQIGKAFTEVGTSLRSRIKQLTAQAANVSLVDKTTARANALTSQTAVYQAVSTQLVNSIQAAATAITDKSRVNADITASGTQGISDVTQAQNDASAAIVQGIQDQTAIQVDQLGLQGLYGAQLVAQQAKVAVDQQTLLDHQNEATAQAHLDSVTSQQNQLVASDQLALDRITQSNDATIARDQASLDRTSITSAINAGKSQAALDAAQAHADAVQFGTESQKTAAAGALQVAEANNKAAQALSDSNTATASAILQQDQANAAKDQATAQDLLTQDQANAAQQIALASQSLASTTNTAAQTEAKLQSIYDVDAAIANGQNSGGVNVFITGIPQENAAAIGAAASFALRFKVS